MCSGLRVLGKTDWAAKLTWAVQLSESRTLLDANLRRCVCRLEAGGGAGAFEVVSALKNVTWKHFWHQL